MLKIVSENFIHALLLCLGLFLKISRWVPLKKHMRKLCINGKISTDPHCILKEQERFYRELYKSSINSPNIGEKISSFLNDLNIPQLSEEQKNSCEGLISLEECSKVLVTSKGRFYQVRK